MVKQFKFIYTNVAQEVYELFQNLLISFYTNFAIKT